MQHLWRTHWRWGGITAEPRSVLFSSACSRLQYCTAWLMLGAPWMHSKSQSGDENCIISPVDATARRANPCFMLDQPKVVVCSCEVAISHTNPITVHIIDDPPSYQSSVKLNLTRAEFALRRSDSKTKIQPMSAAIADRGIVYDPSTNRLFSCWTAGPSQVPCPFPRTLIIIMLLLLLSSRRPSTFLLDSFD